MKIAIIGTGISGLGAAWLLNPSHDITVYERNQRLGGHSNTVDVDYDGVPIPVDTGFIVYNTLNYPNLTALFHALGVATEDSDMSFSFSQRNSALEWSGDNLNTVFCYRRNLIHPTFLKMLGGILRFNKLALQDLDDGYLEGLSLGAYLERRGFNHAFRDHYLLPMGSAIWSTSLHEMLEYPASTFIQFFANHRLMHATQDRPQWRTVTGGSRAYVKRLSAPFRDKIRLGVDIAYIDREQGSPRITHHDGQEERFDHIIFACHSDEALALLRDPTESEKAILGAIHYSPNKAVLHRDVSLMPHRHKAWASWNYMSEKGQEGSAAPASVTYWMNRLQNIDRQYPLFVSLNPVQEPDPHLVFQTFDYMHPLYNKPALDAQKKLDRLQGVQNTWFCGAYFGYGFHEDGLTSGLNVCKQLGLTPPWESETISSQPSTYTQAAE